MYMRRFAAQTNVDKVIETTEKNDYMSGGISVTNLIPSAFGPLHEDTEGSVSKS